MNTTLANATEVALSDPVLEWKIGMAIMLLLCVFLIVFVVTGLFGEACLCLHWVRLRCAMCCCARCCDRKRTLEQLYAVKLAVLGTRDDSGMSA
jgi:hypothetical protein